jgi:Flp pilus assembly protein TadG
MGMTWIAGMPRARQRGMSSIEFAIMLPVFLLVLYGIVSYGMIFAAQQALTLASEEGARAALQNQGVAQDIPQASATANVVSLKTAAALTACTSDLAWVVQLAPNNVACTVTTPANCPNAGMVCIQVNATYANYDQNPLVPSPWPFKSSPLLPAQISMASIVEIDPISAN